MDKLAWVKWEDHASQVFYRGPEKDRKAGEGALIDFMTDREGQPAAIVMHEGSYIMMPLSEIKFVRWNEPSSPDEKQEVAQRRP
jgi:hypothetical protein